jgi:hypothetical protein
MAVLVQLRASPIMYSSSVHFRMNAWPSCRYGRGGSYSRRLNFVERMLRARGPCVRLRQRRGLVGSERGRAQQLQLRVEGRRCQGQQYRDESLREHVENGCASTTAHASNRELLSSPGKAAHEGGGVCLCFVLQ